MNAYKPLQPTTMLMEQMTITTVMTIIDIKTASMFSVICGGTVQSHKTDAQLYTVTFE